MCRLDVVVRRLDAVEHLLSLVSVTNGSRSGGGKVRRLEVDELERRRGEGDPIDCRRKVSRVRDDGSGVGASVSSRSIESGHFDRSSPRPFGFSPLISFLGRPMMVVSGDMRRKLGHGSGSIQRRR